MFSPQRVAQTAAEFLRRAGGRVHALKLLRLIYVSDRVSMHRHGMPITYDRLVSMDHGPVPLRTFNYILGYESDEWDRWIVGVEGHQLSLVRPDFERDDLSELSDADIEIIGGTWDEFRELPLEKLRDHAYWHCPEWEDPDGSAFPLYEKKIFEAFGRASDEARRAQEEIEVQRHLDRVFTHR